MSTSPELASTTPLLPLARRTTGVRNLVRKEMGQWWTTRTWWIHLILWIVVLDVVSALVVRDPDLTAADALAEAIRTFLLMCAAAVAVGVVVTVQGAVVGEKELGTAAWVISKPVSRRSFITAKLVAHVTGFLVTAVVVPALGFILVAQTADVPSIDLGRFAAGVAVVALAVSFYVVLTLALGVLFTGRGPIAGIGVGLVLTGLFFRGMLPTALVVATPWPLGDVAASLALGTDLDFTWYVPVLINVATGAALLTIALWRFEREEL